MRTGEGTPNRAKAIIYCRVSSEKQVSQGHGLDSQEMRGRTYAKLHGYDVAAVFRDEGVSGAVIERPGMQQVLACLRAAREPMVVVIDDISRFARSVEAHITLKAAIHMAGGRLESPSHTFGTMPEEQFTEIVMAGVAELARNQNARQVRNRMKDRLKARVWVLGAPVGYRFGRHPQHGKMLLRDEPRASIVKEAIEGFASGRFEGQVDVQRFLEGQGDFPKDKRGKVHLQRVKHLLTCQLYTGFFEYPRWDIGWTEGHHEPLVSLDTYQRNQERLGLRAKAPYRKDLREDFPLRGFVLCDECGQPVTAAWSTGRTSRHAYYRCNRKGCPAYGKGIRGCEIESQFATLLEQLQPSPPVIAVTGRIVEAAWRRMTRQVRARADDRRKQIEALERKIAGLLDAAVNASSQEIRGHYEEHVLRSQREISTLKEATRLDASTDTSLGGAVGTALEFMANLRHIWENGDLGHRRLVLNLAFARRLRYNRKTGFGTTEYSLPFRVVGGWKTMEYEMVDADFERWNQIVPILRSWATILNDHKNVGLDGCEASIGGYK